MISVYSPNETDFTNNGLSVLSPVECTVTEELNGMFELKLIHPVDNPSRLRVLNEYYIIRAPTPRGYQLFRIYHTSRSMKNMITVYCRHIFYDGAFNNLSVKAEGVTPDEAVKLIYSSLAYPLSFTASSDINGTVDAEYVDINPVYALIDGEDGLAKKLEGELLRDNYEIKLLKSIGCDNGVHIRYRKNLVGLDFTIDVSDVATMIKPKAVGLDDEELLLPEVYIESDLIDAYPMPMIRVEDYHDIRLGKDYTEETAFDEMRKRTMQLFDSGIDKPIINAKIDFVNLGDTEEYKEYKLLEQVMLGDTITIIHEGLNVNVKAKCIKYSYNSILQRYEKMEVGNLLEDIASVIGGVESIYGSVYALNAQLEARVAKVEAMLEN